MTQKLQLLPHACGSFIQQQGQECIRIKMEHDHKAHRLIWDSGRCNIWSIYLRNRTTTSWIYTFIWVCGKFTEKHSSLLLNHPFTSVNIQHHFKRQIPHIHMVRTTLTSGIYKKVTLKLCADQIQTLHWTLQTSPPPGLQSSSMLLQSHLTS